MISKEEKKTIEDLKDTLKISDEMFEEVGDRLIDTRSSLQIQTILNLIETQNKMIELMAECFINFEVKWYCKYILPADWKCASKENCIKCIIEYFRNKAKESE